MGTINISTEPVPVTVDGTTFLLLGDPSGTKAWATLMDLDISYSNAEERDEALAAMLDALTEMAADPDSASVLRELFTGETRGILTLKSVVKGYVEAVTDFPTQPSQPSKKR